MACLLCEQPGGPLVHQGPRWRVIRAAEAAFPAFYRVVWQEHVAEFTDLDAAARAECLTVVAEVESALRRHLQPTKVNLAALGNQVPHLHWHVIARFTDDSHFPDPVWAAPKRAVDAALTSRLTAALPALEADLRERLARFSGG